MQSGVGPTDVLNKAGVAVGKLFDECIFKERVNDG